ncbi:MAG TPA: hypothetical protein VK582_14180 [Pyrinomonadaceae bacterium]|nr:hypothetical protein [Pyrinomonadaceae bacterium]
MDKPLARALAETEIADAAWAHDGTWSKDLLRDAYELTFPDGEEQSRLRTIPVGAQHSLPSSLDQARQALRRRILSVAGRDRGFVAELVKLGTTQLGAYEGHMEYASLAREALTQNDIESAGHYIDQAIDTDPTQVGTLLAIEQLAARDRAAADSIILQYIQRLSNTPLSFTNGSVMRTTYALARLIYPSRKEGQIISPPGPAVMRAYVRYVLNSLTSLELQYPGSLITSRILLIQTYPLLKQYAPELTQQFLDLEQRSRKPGENFSLPTTKGIEEDYKTKFDKQVERELESDQPDELVIQRAISRGDFAKARKMIDKLADGSQKTQLIETVNAEQAISFANKGDILSAQKLAESLVKATSILRVFPIIAGKCATKKDETCARDSVAQAIKQLRNADLTPNASPPGVPASIMGTSRDFDPVLAGLGSLASAVMSAKDDLAFDVLDELVIAANHSKLDTSEGRTGFETSLFKKLAEMNEGRVNLAAMQLKDPLSQIVALAAIDQWKSDKLTADAKLRSAKNEPPRKKN